MTLQILNVPITKSSKESCHTCGIKIKVGDLVITKSGFRKGIRPIRYESCGMIVGVI